VLVTVGTVPITTTHIGQRMGPPGAVEAAGAAPAAGIETEAVS
jgi:hypothetical protein